MTTNYITKEIHFAPTTSQNKIDSFVMPIPLLNAEGYSVKLANISNKVDYPDALWETIDEHVSSEMIWDYANSFGKQTTILDIQVGRGKTTACYNIIEQYYKEKDHLIIVLSPFKKLVEKDYDEITQKGIPAFNYLDLKRSAKQDASSVISNALEKKVHVMTVNCLLNNPGEDAFDISKLKRDYLTALLNKCKRDNLKVILFFDEIHEAIHNFEPLLIPNLYKWGPVVKHCYIASATFTAQSYPVIKYIAGLTNKQIMLVSLERTKWKPEKISKLHLHIVSQMYSSQRLEPLSHLKHILENSTDKQVHILTGTRSLAKALMAEKDEIGEVNSFLQYLNPFNFNLVTPDTTNEFQVKGNNIGTTFKTGVNIEKRDGDKDVLYIILLPVAAKDTIFSDGIPSIVQAMGRPRNGGDIHLFMYRPTHLIESDLNAEYHFTDELKKIGYLYLDLYKPLAERLPEWFTKNLKTTYFSDQYKAIDLLKQEYNKQFERNKSEIEILSKDSTNSYRLLPFDEYLMTAGRKLVRTMPQYGSDLSSYVLFAAMNGQFCNATLETMSYTYVQRKMVDIEKKDILSVLPDAIGIDELTHACNLGLVDAIESMMNAMRFDRETGEEVQYTYNKQSRSLGELKAFPSFIQALAALYVTIITNGKFTTLSKEDYILACCLSAANSTDDISTNREKYFKTLNKYRVQFLNSISKEVIQNEKGEHLIHKNVSDTLLDHRIKAIEQTALKINSSDWLIDSGAFPFLAELSKEKDDKKKKAKVYRELEKCFTNVTGDKRSFKGQKEKYYRIDGKLERTLAPEILALRLL